MSNLAVKGNTAGLGTVTIETPATAANRTLALPDVDGTVHTSGGVNDHASMPTVAGDPIVESGSNTDGNWTKWADGTLRSSKKFTIPGTGANFYNMSNVPHPVPYVGSPLNGSVSSYSNYNGTGSNGVSRQSLAAYPADYDFGVEEKNSVPSNYNMIVTVGFIGAWK